MDTHHIFKTFILPTLLAIADQLGVLGNVSGISLYGSANYKPHDRESLTDSSSQWESDYDIWIVFKKGCLSESQKFATSLFGVNFSSVPKQEPCILYDKITLEISMDKFLIAPIIITEDCYELLRGNASEVTRDVLLTWYRPRARERPPKVPVCNTEFIWSEFDMQQTYLSDLGLWRLMMPIVIKKGGVATLGTFIESALSGDCFYGDGQQMDEWRGMLIRDAVQYLCLNETLNQPLIPTALYKMMTLESKAGPRFKEWKIQQFSHWLSK